MVLQALNLRSNERRPVALLWTHSFFLGVGVAYLISAALPIFLASFPIDYLPLAFAAAAALELLIGIFPIAWNIPLARSACCG